MIGVRLRPERRTFRDVATGARVTRWTAAPAMHHQLYFTNSSWPAAGGRFYLICYRDGYPNLLACDEADGALMQVTARVDLNPFSPAVAPDGSALYATAGEQVLRIDAETLEVAPLARFAGARLGNCSLDPAGRRIAVGCRYDGYGELALVCCDGSGADAVLRCDEVGHLQFRPCDPETLLFSGPPTQRMWLVRADGSGLRPLYEQTTDEWIVHESWLGAGDEVIFTHWPRALRAIDPDSGAVRTVAEFAAWHACGRRDGRSIVCDTARPSRGLFLLDPITGAARRLCQPNASAQGRQWALTVPAAGAGIDTSIIRGDDPASDPAPTPAMPEGVYGPQWTHPHPSFSPDGRRVIYTSDNGGGWSHVYTVEVPE